MSSKAFYTLFLTPLFITVGWTIVASLLPHIHQSWIEIWISPLLLFLLPSLLVSPWALAEYRSEAWRQLLNISIQGVPIRGFPLVLSLACLLPFCAYSIMTLSELVWTWVELDTHPSSIDSVQNSVMLITLEQNLSPFLGLLAFCVLPSVCEELYFRYSLQRALTTWLGKDRILFCITITSLIFSLLHFSPIGFFPRFAISFVLGYIYHQTTSLTLVSSLHFFNNLLALLFTYTINCNY